MLPGREEREFEIDYFVLDKMDIEETDVLYTSEDSMYQLEASYKTLNLYSVRE